MGVSIWKCEAAHLEQSAGTPNFLVLVFAIAYCSSVGVSWH